MKIIRVGVVFLYYDCILNWTKVQISVMCELEHRIQNNFVKLLKKCCPNVARISQKQPN
jgi:hypothetical protein